MDRGWLPNVFGTADPNQGNDGPVAEDNAKGTRKQDPEQQGPQICQLLDAQRFRQKLFVLAQLLQALS